MRYLIVDDDRASRMMLTNIIHDAVLGTVIGEAVDGEEAISQILMMQPDFVLIDLLMPKMDGIETVRRLKENRFRGSIIMLSQVINKEMVEAAYNEGVEYFIHKPINKTEVMTILRKTEEQHRLKQSLQLIKDSLTNFDTSKPQTKKTVRDHVHSILSDLGIVGEVGSDDITKMIEQLVAEKNQLAPLPPLKELYEKIAMQTKETPDEILKESKAIEQRIRRTILAGMINLANLGIVDYTNSEFEYYAPRYFDLTEIRQLMNQIELGGDKKAKVNIKKFIQVLLSEIFSRID